jgi:hypothetical protein
MKFLSKQKKKIALGMLFVLAGNLLAPVVAFALTSGPVQPETQGFQPAGVSDMVDLQTGSFKYNIPLLDIDGYPINLNYQSGSNMDDEASWVGFGWNLNPGAINRQVRGVPDDFSIGDTVEDDNYVKPEVTVGGSVNAKFESFGTALSTTVSLGLFNNNYTGIGAEIGANAGLSYGIANGGLLTASLGLGVESNTQSGVSLTPSVNLSIQQQVSKEVTTSAALSSSLGYNSRSGMKSLTMGASFGVGLKSLKEDKDENGNVVSPTDQEYENAKTESADYDAGGTSISYNTETVSPAIQIPYTTTYNSFSFNVGLAAEGQFPSFGGTGYQSIKKVTNFATFKNPYGFLYAEKGKNDANAVMDFIREKDNPIVPGIPNIAIPIHTPDLWTYSSQAGSGQFRLYRGGSGVFFDNHAQDQSSMNTAGADFGVGSYFHGGISYFKQSTSNDTHKWVNNNNYLANGDFQNQDNTNPNNENVYFRQTGEKGLSDAQINTQTYGYQPLSVYLAGSTAAAKFITAANQTVTEQPLLKTIRRPNQTVISYLTAKEASLAGLDKMIKHYALNTLTTNSYAGRPTAHDSVGRIDGYHKPHHISEITVTDGDGKRMVYGIPVYNYTQDEYTFAVGGTGRTGIGGTYPANNQVAVPANPSQNNLGVDNYYQRDHKSAYATSYLLTAILSPDYVDKTGNGISDDDLGTAIKFNYSKSTGSYKWRSPYLNSTLNKCLLADPDDDKGSVVYGQKELWYVSSIETKTKVAYFITATRNDDLGVTNWQNPAQDLVNKQRYLSQIRLYSKADMSKPIKVVNFKYTYALCNGLPNNSGGSGKLTLSQVWFTYGNSDKGMHYPYTFTYNTSANGATPTYGYMVSDRWGIYKSASENPNSLTNDADPYATQDSTIRSQNVALWQLSGIALPTGGNITVAYESGDYAYVQNQKATVVSQPTSLVDQNANPVSTLSSAHGLRVSIGTTIPLPAGVDTTSWFENNYLNGSSYFYTKLSVKLATGLASTPQSCTYEYVPCYALISRVVVSGRSANVIFENITESGVTVNPISIAAWQMIKNEYPRYAYAGFDNRVQSANSSVIAAITAVINAAKNLTELTQNFYEKASANKYADSVNLGQSFVKIEAISGHKFGGSARVKKISINDNWSTMTQNRLTNSESYGQSYDYTTIDNGQVISSGVATYEPYIGNDENALKQPVPYIQHIKGAISNYFDLEMPFCESLYPAPEIGYSKVTVRDLDQNGNPSEKTGYIINEFYTAKDFPVIVKSLPIISHENRPASHYSLTSSTSIDSLTLSQGYSIQLNDMHGKQKAVSVYNQAGALISSTVYNYNVDNTGALSNQVNVIGSNGVMTSQVIGQELEFFTDFREQVTNNTGNTINLGVDVFPVPFIPGFFALPHNPYNVNNDLKTFRSAAAVKVIQSYGLINNVVKTENGSSITTTNIAYDGLTGEPLVTKTQNEFERPIYCVNIPAYWVYNGMGAAYQNQGVYLQSFSTDSHGVINPAYSSYLKGGDQLLDLNKQVSYWVVDNSGIAGATNTKRLVDSNGLVVRNNPTTHLVKVVRSGFRNMLSPSATTVVCLNNPLVKTGSTTSLQLVSNGDLNSLNVINASANTYDESWSGRPNCPTPVGPRPIVSSYPYPTNMVKSPWFGETLYCDSGALIRPTPGAPFVSNVANYWKQSLYRSGIWIGNPTPPNHIYRGFDTCIFIPLTQTYFLGYSADNHIKIYIDDILTDSASDLQRWYITPHLLTAGLHKLRAQFSNDTTEYAAGVEVYNNSAADLENGGITSANIIFSSINLVGKSNLQIYTNQQPSSSQPGPYVYRYTYTDGSPANMCFPEYIPIPDVVNPYQTGFLGNWRPYQSEVFQQSRYNVALTTPANEGADLRNGGYIKHFYSYWYYGSGGWAPNANTTKWITANTVTLYDKYGQQLENKDALGRNSAALFDFNGELPSAVASNAMNREIYARSFEDNKFTLGASNDTCGGREFKEPSTGYTISKFADSLLSHTGNFSATLPSDGVVMATNVYSRQQKTDPYLALDTANQYVTKVDTGLYPNGFEPAPGKKYVFDAWVFDNSPTTTAVNVNFQMNGINVPLKCRAVVEGWKLVEGTFLVQTLKPDSALRLAIIPAAGYTINIDDIRMFPFNSQIKTYAYDDQTLRLMAELDENCFATFYEYDDEGLLVRVKKETQKGIMTIKESRSSYKKIQ